MGWSCRADAAKTMDRWSAICREQTGSSNVYIVKGVRFFFETSRREHADGAITGTVHKFTDETHCRKVCGFRIEGNGEVARGPAVLKLAHREVWGSETNDQA